MVIYFAVLWASHLAAFRVESNILIIDRQPLGLNARIGSEETYLSGGEQQRIFLARVILKNAPIVILDEATCRPRKRTSDLQGETDIKTGQLNGETETEVSGEVCLVIFFFYFQMTLLQRSKE
jgi:predicted ABC-type transport system involved in lysophospholipase L1 biosynthesis ATPase subunit